LTERRSFIILQTVLPFVARLLARQGQGERAVEVYALASRYGYVANSHRYHDLVGQYIEGLVASLPPDVVASAQAHGRARDVWATAEELLADFVLYPDE
jgi:hypothetical protein